MKLNCIVIEDEPIARQGMEELIRKVDYLHFAGSFRDPLAALQILEEQRIDIMFLDIRMPELNGISFLKTLPNPPATIITTAYSHYAVESFELNVKDYLLKPISIERFLMAVTKVKSGIVAPQEYIFIKCDTQIQKIFLSEILFVKALENYVIIQCKDKKYLSYLTLKSVEDFLPSDLFVKIHKSYIIAISKVTSIEANTIRMGDFEVSFNRNNKEEIMNTILKNNFLKR